MDKNFYQIFTKRIQKKFMYAAILVLTCFTFSLIISSLSSTKHFKNENENFYYITLNPLFNHLLLQSDLYGLSKTEFNQTSKKNVLTITTVRKKDEEVFRVVKSENLKLLKMNLVGSKIIAARMQELDPDATEIITVHEFPL